MARLIPRSQRPHVVKRPFAEPGADVPVKLSEAIFARWTNCALRQVSRLLRARGKIPTAPLALLTFIVTIEGPIIILTRRPIGARCRAGGLLFTGFAYGTSMMSRIRPALNAVRLPRQRLGSFCIFHPSTAASPQSAVAVSEKMAASRASQTMLLNRRGQVS